MPDVAIRLQNMSCYNPVDNNLNYMIIIIIIIGAPCCVGPLSRQHAEFL
jgi:hypothetical protein